MSRNLDVETKAYSHAEEVEQDVVFSEKAAVADFKADAIEAENAEHNMTVLQAVKAYPMASFWAFVISCTIVSLFFYRDARWEGAAIHIANRYPDYGIIRRFPHW